MAHRDESRTTVKPRLYTAFDRAMIESKMQDQQVEFSMAMPVFDEEGKEATKVVGKVISVDIFTIEVEWDQTEGTIWLNKAAMIGARTLI